MKIIKRTMIILAVLVLMTGTAGAETIPAFRYPFGVILNVCDDLEQFADYETIVIDAQYYTREQINSFRSKGHKVFSYINIGSLEDFRDYYEDYKDLAPGRL